ncbi:cell death activator CIDE-3-like [Nomascus leucogenys]|uniref:cell death activator CIDE-3-like n=1 Tax=Nomascus leucogenys TaxID=61853 RepID=UPI00122D51E0|nr:cell death activator CIDE-3-like [Nomascus leucogenys]
MLADEPFFLVLEEDGTTVETERLSFQALAGDTVFLVLQKGQKWEPLSEQGMRHPLFLPHKPAKKMDVARITFDLNKLSPQDFISCLNVKVTFYDVYSLSYDLHCMRLSACWHVKNRSVSAVTTARAYTRQDACGPHPPISSGQLIWLRKRSGAGGKA